MTDITNGSIANVIYDTPLMLADKESIEVVEHDFKSDRIKGLYVDTKDKICIAINKCLNNDLEAKALVLAHELGHHKLHRGLGDIARDKHSSLYEEQADSYANDLIESIEASCSYK